MQTPKHHESSNIQSLLTMGNYGQAASNLVPEDPMVPMQMLVDIDNIKPYDRNPRRARNPKYDEIRDSIYARGALNTPLTITRRPGDTHYMVESGGNTRLEALNELWRTTGDRRFFKILCIFHPWKNESHVLSSHLIENELRGDMVFVDKALAVMSLKQQFEAECGDAISQRSFIDILHSNGMKISRPQLYRIAYVVDVLYPLIPLALAAGLGVREIDTLRQTLDSYRQVFISNAAQLEEVYDNPGAVFDAAVADVFVASDSETWSFESTIRELLEVRMSQLLGSDIKQLKQEFAVIAIKKSKQNSDELPGNSDEIQPNPGGTLAKDANPAKRGSKNQSEGDGVGASPSAEKAPKSSPSHDIQQLRMHIYTTAAVFIQDAFEIDETEVSQLLVKTPHYGVGYLINSRQLANARQQHAWWLIASLSAVFESEISFHEACELGCVISPDATGDPDPLPQLIYHICVTQTDLQIQTLISLVNAIRSLRAMIGAGENWRHAK